jgi:hypothetical protein
MKDFYDNVPEFTEEAIRAAWPDPISRVRERRWFADAKSIPQRIAVRSILSEVEKMAEDVRFLES